jgi:Leucine rich repeat
VAASIVLTVLMLNDTTTIKDHGQAVDVDADGTHPSSAGGKPQPQQQRLPLEDYYDLLYDHLNDNRQVNGLQDPSTPVFEALEWMAFQDGMVWQLLDDRKPPGIHVQTVEQRFAIVVFYFATAGADFWDPNWLRRGVSECEYDGITCHPEDNNNTKNTNTMGNTTNVVIQLDLEDQSLIGPIPSQLAWLTSLQALILSSNRLHGSIPSEIFSSLVNLREIRLSFNELTGTLPPDWSNLSHLEDIALRGNRLEGSLPWKLPPKVKTLEVHYNPSMTGTLPLQEWSDYFLDTDKGDIPCQLELLDVGATAISGTIHGPSLATSVFGNLRSLTLHQTKLEGPVPTELGSLSALMELALSDIPLLTGTFPTELYNLSQLRYLIANDVNLYGHFLEDVRISQWRHMEALVLSHSRLSGTLPSEIGLLTELSMLQVSHSYMTGSIPTEVAKLTNLEIGWFHGTQISGSVPSDVCGIKDIQKDWRVSCEVECACCYICTRY